MVAAREWARRTWTAPREWEHPEVASFSEIEGLRRGELRLAAEVGLAVITGKQVDHDVRVKAALIFNQMLGG